MEIKETIYVKKEYLYYFNMYMLKQNKNLGLLIVGVFFTILGLYGVIFGKDEDIVYDLLTILVGVCGILFATIVSKFILKRKVKKSNFEDLPPIEVTANDNGILYKYIEENQKEYLPYRWREIYKVVKTNDYIYIHLIDKRSIMLITIRDLKNTELIDILKEKLSDKKKFIEIK